MNQYDIIIVGSGAVGATSALTLAKDSALKIALLDAQPIAAHWQAEKIDQRVSAISLASKNIFKYLNVWSDIQAKRVSPYTKMFVWDEAGAGQIQFDCADVNAETLGYIIEDNVVRTSLISKISAYSNIELIHPIKLQALQRYADRVELIATDRRMFSTKLLIAADGANSWVRAQMDTELKTRDYAQTALVATVQTELSHQATAWQRFLTTGPLAFLPLRDSHTCSIVWSAKHAYAEELLALSDDEFCQRLSMAFAEKLGKINHTTARLHFPLRMRHVKNYVQDRIAYIGDAAHTLHPLAGQGINLGLLDAACLSEVILTAAAKNRDFANVGTLRKYERWRKSDNLLMLTAVDVLKHLFMSSSSHLRRARNAGLDFTNRAPLLKNIFMNYALGHRGDLPSAAKNFFS
jgi:2-octaprenylphenol hydroxylase